MAVPPVQATTREERYAPGPGPGADLPLARIVALVLILVCLVAWIVVGTQAQAGPAQGATDIASFNPRTIFGDSTPHFLPTPVAALPAQSNAGPAAPPAGDQTAPAAPTERVKIANTGGAGAILRADPPKGRQVAALRDGTVLQVLDRRQLDDGSEWLQVKTPDGVEGWIFSRLVVAAE